MNEPQNPYDPYGNQSGPASADGPTGTGEGSPTSDPALHPHDPYAYPAGGAPAAGQPGAAPDAQAGTAAGQGAASGPAAGGYGPPAGAYGAQPGGGGQPHGGAGPHAGNSNLDVPPPGFKGVYDGPLTGQPLQETDAKTWALVVHLSALLQFVIPLLGGLIAQIVLFVLFKDRNRFVRYNAAEALNGTIAALIISLGLGVIFTIITIITFGIGAVLFGLMFIPTTVQAVFAIIGAVKAYQGTWWNYPANIRLVK